jgi:O-antigen ligase
MSASVARVGDSLRVAPRAAWLIAMFGLVGVATLVAVATWLGMLPMLLGVVLLGLATLVGLRWPLVPLIVFVALIPVEEVTLIDGFGTISKAAGILFAVAYGVPRLGRLALGAMPPAAWAYLAWAILSLGWAIDADTAWLELLTLLQLFLIAVLVADFVAQRPAIVRPILWAYSLSAATTALIGIESYITQGIADTRAAAIENQNPAQFAAILLPALVFGLYEALTGERRVLGGMVAVLTTIGVVVSGTRGAWVAVAVVLLLILFQLRPQRRIAAIGAILTLAAILSQVPGVIDLVAERTGSALSTGGSGRTDIWSVAGTIYQSAPVLGVGYANFGVANTSQVVVAANVRSGSHFQGYGPHNVVVGTLIELGPFGLLLLVVLLGPLVLRRGWGPDAATIQAALASLLTLALFLDILSNRKQVWLVIGLAAGLAYIARRNRRTPIDAGSVPEDSSGGLPARTELLPRGPDVARSAARH